MRSKLFVPGARADFFEKALGGEADALSFDLEDSVPADGKATARAQSSAFLRSDAVRSSSKTIIVRVNSLETPFFEQDVEALADAHVHLVNVPKVEGPAAAEAAAERILATCPGARLLLNIETPRGLAEARRIAVAHRGIAGLQIGLNDLFGPLNIDRPDASNVHAALWQVRLAAAQAELFAYDGAWPDLDDIDGFRREAELARGLGFIGKSCIHPRQVAVANSVFERGDGIAAARRIVDAARAARAAGRGAFVLDGKMIDAPAIAQAEAVLAGAGDAR
jgi:citrate lyase subunit beta/citryl-CoA lyase